MFEQNGLKKIYQFDHSKSDVLSALGLTNQSRLNEILKIILKIDAPQVKTTQVMQNIVNSDDLSDIEKIFLLYALGRQREGKVKDVHNNMPKLSVEVIGNPPKEIKEALDNLKSLADVIDLLKKMEKSTKDEEPHED